MVIIHPNKYQKIIDELNGLSLNVSVNPNEIFKTNDYTIKLNEKYELPEKIEIEIEIPSDIKNKLDSTYGIFALIKFQKSKYRKYQKLTYNTNLIDIDKNDIAGNGIMEFIVVDLKSKKYERVYTLEKWKISFNTAEFDSDFLFIWKNFEKDSRYKKYNNVIMDISVEYDPIIFLNKDVAGMYNLLSNKQKHPTIIKQNIVNQIIYSYAMLAMAIYDLLYLKTNCDNDINLEELNSDKLRRLEIYFSDTTPKVDDNVYISEQLDDLLNNNQYDIISEVILGIQQNSSLRTDIEYLIKGGK